MYLITSFNLAIDIKTRRPQNNQFDGRAFCNAGPGVRTKLIVKIRLIPSLESLKDWIKMRFRNRFHQNAVLLCIYYIAQIDKLYIYLIYLFEVIILYYISIYIELYKLVINSMSPVTGRACNCRTNLSDFGTGIRNSIL